MKILTLKALCLCTFAIISLICPCACTSKVSQSNSLSDKVTSYFNSQEIRISSSTPRISKTKKIGNFTHIQASGVSVYVTIGKASGIVRMDIPEPLKNDVVVEVTDGVLIARTVMTGRGVSYNSSTMPRIYVTVPELSTINTTLSGGVYIEQLHSQSSLKLETSTSGRIEIGSLTINNLLCKASTSGAIAIKNLAANNINLGSSTSGKIYIAGGHAENANYSASTSGAIKCASLAVRNGNAMATTSGTISCNIINASTSHSTSGVVNNRQN